MTVPRRSVELIVLALLAQGSAAAQPPAVPTSEELVARKTLRGPEVPYFICVVSFLNMKLPEEDLGHFLTGAVDLDQTDQNVFIEAQRTYFAEQE